MSPSLQRNLLLQALASIHPSDFHIFTNGSVLGGIEDGCAGLVVLSQDNFVHEYHAPASTHRSSFQAEKAALKKAIHWLSSISSWASAIIICNCKSLVQAVSNANSADWSVIQLQATVAVLAMSKIFLIVWAPGHCGLSGNELADHHQAKLAAADTQPDNALKLATWRALIQCSCHPLPSNTSR